MSTILILKLAFIFALSWINIKLLIHFAPKLGLVDVPNHRSVHANHTPRGAGIGMIFAVILSDIVFYTLTPLTHIWTLLAIFLVFIIGILDDHSDTTPKTKFLVIFVAVLFCYMDNIAIYSLGTMFGYTITLGWLTIPFTMFAVAGFTNALNLSDGLDGLAGSLSIIILSALGVIGYHHNDIFMVSLSASFITVLLAFLWFNWNPAKIFMGDSGSLTLGMVISVLSIKALTYVQSAIILFIAALPIMDTLIVMIRRKSQGKSIFSPDKTHLHHILLIFFNGNVKKTVIFLIVVQLFYSLIGLSFIETHFNQLYALILFLISLSMLYILLNAMVDRQKLSSLHKKKTKNSHF
jgi:UDP-GlcNAc:undecaprenyl-phosphate GlcNAc-1-phosphate transferase